MTSIKRISDVRHIDWTGYQAIGEGSYSVVFVKPRGRFAIKVGRIAQSEIEGLREAARHKLAPEVYAYWPHAQASDLPAWVRSRVNLFSDGTVGVVIVQRAKPAIVSLDDDAPFNWDYFNKLEETVCRALKQKCYAVGLDWPDDHAGNIGRIGRRWVVLDGFNYSPSDISAEDGGYPHYDDDSYSYSNGNDSWQW